ncbi:2-dehydro-3-deoxyglucarate aldolase [Streptomyces sp. NBRC 110611]|nr:2-dehydro-3-deoxyglucarate aldolase [Streptomyces sp. NBRC 110611]
MSRRDGHGPSRQDGHGPWRHYMHPCPQPPNYSPAAGALRRPTREPSPTPPDSRRGGAGDYPQLEEEIARVRRGLDELRRSGSTEH